VKTVLIVDDEPMVRQLLRSVLARLPCQVLEAADGLSAVALAKQERPDVVLLDLTMPGLDGWGVLAALRADPTTAAIKVLVITANVHVTASMVQAAGAYGILYKPFRLAELLAQIKPLLA
jgi:CheY-like chemotaxis protein